MPDSPDRPRSAASLEERLREAIRENDRLRRELHQTRLAISRRRELVFSTDQTRGRFEYISPNAEEITGFGVDELRELGPDFMLTRFPPPDLAAAGRRVQCAIAQARGRIVHVTLTHRWLHKSGELHHCWATVTLTLGPKGQILGGTGITRECTPWERAKADTVLCPHRRFPDIELPGFPNGWEKFSQECPLTPTECTVLNLIFRGRTNEQMAAELHRSRRTVEDHRRQVMSKLQASTAADLVFKALQHTCRSPDTLEPQIP